MTPETLAAGLPVELRAFDGLESTGAYRSRTTAVADWLNTQIPGQGRELAPSVMTAAGLSVAAFFRRRFDSTPANTAGDLDAT